MKPVKILVLLSSILVSSLSFALDLEDSDVHFLTYGSKFRLVGEATGDTCNGSFLVGEIVALGADQRGTKVAYFEGGVASTVMECSDRRMVKKTVSSEWYEVRSADQYILLAPQWLKLETK